MYYLPREYITSVKTKVLVTNGVRPLRMATTVYERGIGCDATYFPTKPSQPECFFTDKFKSVTKTEGKLILGHQQAWRGNEAIFVNNSFA